MSLIYLNFFLSSYKQKLNYVNFKLNKYILNNLNFKKTLIHLTKLGIISNTIQNNNTIILTLPSLATTLLWNYVKFFNKKNYFLQVKYLKLINNLAPNSIILIKNGRNLLSLKASIGDNKGGLLRLILV